MDEADGVIPADMLITPTSNNPSWKEAVLLSPELMRRLDMLADEIGAVDPDVPIFWPYCPWRVGTALRGADSRAEPG
jgi:hypothetical protein